MGIIRGGLIPKTIGRYMFMGCVSDKGIEKKIIPIPINYAENNSWDLIERTSPFYIVDTTSKGTRKLTGDINLPELNEGLSIRIKEEEKMFLWMKSNEYSLDWEGKEYPIEFEPVEAS